MDVRTTNLLQSLDGTAIKLVAALLEKPRAEKALVRDLDGLTQPNAHKKLQRLEQAGLLRQPPEGTRGQPWTVAAPEPTARFVEALLALSDELDALDRHEREAIRRRLRKQATNPIADDEAPS